MIRKIYRKLLTIKSILVKKRGAPMSKPLKVGLIGTGGISRQHLPAYAEFSDEVKLTAVCDIFEEAAQERAK